MARIRTIKPEFPESESMGRVSREARLLFIMLWLACDDEGRTRGHSRKLASTLYPYDEDAANLIDGWIFELEKENCVRRYQSDGATYLQVLGWRKHQKIDKPSKSRLPEPPADIEKQPIRELSRKIESPPEGHAKPREASLSDLGPRTLDLGPSSEAKASEPGGSSSSVVIDLFAQKVEEIAPPPVVTAIDLEAQVWAIGKAYLTEHGVSKAQAGGLIGRWRKAMGNDDLEVMRLLRRAQAECVSEPVSFIEGCINSQKGKSNGRGKGQFGNGRAVIDDHPLGNFAAIADRLRVDRESREAFDA